MIIKSEHCPYLTDKLLPKCRKLSCVSFLCVHMCAQIANGVITNMATYYGDVPIGLAAMGGSFNRHALHSCKPDGGDISGADYLGRYSARFSAAMARDSNIWMPGNPETHFGPIFAGSSGVPIYVPPPEVYRIYSRQVVNNQPRYNRAKHTGDIIMSPFSTGQVQLSYTAGRINEQLGTPYLRQRASHGSGLFSDSCPNQSVTDDGISAFGSAGVRLIYQNTRFTEQSNPLLDGWNSKKYVEFLRNRIDSLSLDNSIITSTYAEANRGTIDFLTSAAELPETLRSIMDACKVCLRMYKEARQKAFRIYNKGKGNSNSATAKQNAKELADAISDVWMNYRYNIMPNVYLIQDIIKTLDAELTEYVRFRGTSRETLKSENFLNFTGSSDVSVIQRCLVKRLLDVSSSFPKVDHLVLANVAVTWWELVPLSFVWDWFINIGDLIAAFTINPDVRQEGSTFSWKVEGVEKFINNDTKSTVLCNVSAYRRVNINRSDALSISFNFNLSWKQKLDALCLSWGSTKRLLSK